MDPVDASALLANKEVIRVGNEASPTDWGGRGVRTRGGRVMLAFAGFRGDGDAETIHGGKAKIEVKEPKVLVSGGVREASSIASPTGKEEPGLFPVSAGRLIEFMEAGILQFFDNTPLKVL